MISSNDFHNGLTIKLNGDIFIVTDFQHVKPGKGQAFVRSKLKNLRTGSVVEHTFRAGEKVPRAHLERKTMEYLYSTGEELFFMDSETFEQIAMSESQLSTEAKYLKENMQLEVIFYEREIIGVDLPNFVELKVTETEPGVKGDTVAGSSKPATLETGLVIQVPFFINAGDILKIDTRTGEYIERI